MPQAAMRRAATVATALAAALIAGAALAASTFTIPKAENTNSITMEGDLFGPVVAVVHAGDTVTWTNRDTTTHTVTAYPNQAATFDASVAPGKTTSVTFLQPGVYRYYSSQDGSYDPDLNDVKANQGDPAYPSPMRGVLVVLDKNNSLPASTSNTITIPESSMMFEPWNLTVKAGTTVTWTNDDSDMHVASPVPDYVTQAFPTLSLPGSGGTASYTFSQPGVYYYYCAVHAQWKADKGTMTPLKTYGSYPYVQDGIIIVTP